MAKRKTATKAKASETPPPFSQSPEVDDLAGDIVPSPGQSAAESSAATDTTAKSSGRKQDSPYRVIFVNAEAGFELGENFQFKQRVFRFNEKPDAEVIARLKESGFTYRPSEKAWTRQADFATRSTSDRLAREFADGVLNLQR